MSISSGGALNDGTGICLVIDGEVGSNSLGRRHVANRQWIGSTGDKATRAGPVHKVIAGSGYCGYCAGSTIVVNRLTDCAGKCAIPTGVEGDVEVACCPFGMERSVGRDRCDK